MATGDMFLKLDGVEGESPDATHKASMEIDSWSFGATNSGSSAQGGGAGIGRVNMQDFHFTIKSGKHTPKLFELCATGKPLGQGMLTIRKAGGEQEEFLKVNFNDVLVSSYQIGGHGGSLPGDQCSFNFSKIVIEYKEQKADGTLGGSVKAGWDVKANKKV